MPSPVQLEFLDRTTRDGIAYRTFYGHGVPYSNLGEPGALYVDEDRYVLYGRTDAGWIKFPGTAAEKTKLVRHPVLADTILWCTSNQYGWAKTSDCTNRGSYLGWLTSIIQFEHRKIRLKDPAFVRQTFSFTPVVEAPSMAISPSRPALASTSSSSPPLPPPSSPLPSMPKLDLQAISVRKSAKSSPSNLLRKNPPIRPKARPSVSIEAQSQNRRKTSVRYSPYLAPSSPKHKERESLTGGQSLVESFASTSKGKEKEADNPIGTQQELSPLFTPVQTPPIPKPPSSHKGKGKAFSQDSISTISTHEQLLPLVVDNPVGTSKGKEKEVLPDSREASPLFTPLTADDPVDPIIAKGKEREILSDSISINRKGKARDAAVRSLSPVTDTSPVRHKDMGKESVRYSPYGERSPGPSSPTNRMGRRISVRQPSVPLINHSDTPEPDMQANEVVTPTETTTPKVQETPTLVQPNSITHETIDLTLSDDEDVRDDCSDLAYPTTPEDFDMSEPEFERLPTPPPLPPPLPPVVSEPEPLPAEVGETLSGDQQDVFYRIYRELDTDVYAILFSEIGSNHYCNACLLNAADDADDYVLETFCIAGEGHTMLWHFLMVHCAFKKHYHSIETQTVLHWADLLRLQPQHGS